MAVSSYDASGCFLAVGLAAVGGWLGWTTFGALGAVACIPAGGVVGWFAGYFLVEADFRHSIWMEVRARRRALRGHFGAYWLPDRQADWDRAVVALSNSGTLAGVVVAQFYYGVALDVGNGFPALLTKRCFTEPFSENPPLGAEIAARIDEIKAADREIHLTQLETYAEMLARVQRKP